MGPAEQDKQQINLLIPQHQHQPSLLNLAEPVSRQIRLVEKPQDEQLPPRTEPDPALAQ